MGNSFLYLLLLVYLLILHDYMDLLVMGDFLSLSAHWIFITYGLRSLQDDNHRGRFFLMSISAKSCIHAHLMYEMNLAVSSPKKINYSVPVNCSVSVNSRGQLLNECINQLLLSLVD